MITTLLASLLMNKEKVEPHLWAPFSVRDAIAESSDKVDAEVFLKKCMDICDNFTYDDLLDHYCDAVNYLGKLGSLINGCLVRTCYPDDYIKSSPKLCVNYLI